MSPAPRTTVVIPSWNSLGYLRRCLASPGLREVDVVVVDNGSTDGTLEWLGSLTPRPVVVAHPVNRGFAVAVNAGLRAAGTPFVLVLNADCEVLPGAVEQLEEVLVGRPGSLGVQPLVLQGGTTPPRVYSLGQRIRRDGRAYEHGVGEALDAIMAGERREVFGVCGAACLLRREETLALGGYDERLFAFHEDVDLNLRARLAGWSFDVEPAARVLHVGNAVWQQSAVRPSAFNAHLVARNRLATDLKLLPLRYLPLAALVEGASLLASIPRGTAGATARGKLEALVWAPRLLRERRRLGVRHHADRLTGWLERSSPRRVPRATSASPPDQRR